MHQFLATGGSPSDSTAIIIAIISACAAIVGGLFSWRGATAANRVSERKVDLEEHEQAQTRLKLIIDEQDRHNERLRGQIERLTNQIDAVQQQLAREQDVSNSLRDQIRALRGQVALLEQMVDRHRTGQPPTP